MNRREALKTTSFVAGFTLTASALTAALQSCHTESGERAAESIETWKPVFFDEDQVGLVEALTDTLIPETGTPGAKAVEVHKYIDDALLNLYPPRDQYRFMQGLKDVATQAQNAFGKSFEECSMEDRTALLQQVQDAARTEIDAFEKSGSGGLAVPFFKMLKDLTYEGYFTSEKVGKEVLRFDPIPGSYQGCIPLEDVGRLWTI